MFIQQGGPIGPPCFILNKFYETYNLLPSFYFIPILLPKNNEPEWAGLKIPTNFPAPVQKIEDLNITKAGFELGRKLFYDPLLSKDNTISCGSCHNQGSGFTHHGHDVSHGINDLLGRRNALPVQNLLWQNSFLGWRSSSH